MKKWILLLVLGLLALYLSTFREGFESRSASCPTGYTMDPFAKRCFSDSSVLPTRCPEGQTLENEVCKGPNNLFSVPNCAEGTYDSTGERKCRTEAPPICPDGFTFDSNQGMCNSQTQNPNTGSIPPTIDESETTEPEVERQMVGPVFGSNGPFSGQAGSGQGTGMNAAATLTGSSYAKPIATEGRLDPYDFWPGTKGNRGTSGYGGTKLAGPPVKAVPVEGPEWGGFGSTSSTIYASDAPSADLYGPGSGDTSKGSGSGFGFGYPQKNSQDTSMIPDYRTTGSDPSNVYAVTSRVPGDQDLFPLPYVQSTSYSLANGSQKTDPVPFLADFSAFRN
jgi:hypothetical protein